VICSPVLLGLLKSLGLIHYDPMSPSLDEGIPKEQAMKAVNQTLSKAWTIVSYGASLPCNGSCSHEKMEVEEESQDMLVCSVATDSVYRRRQH